MTARRPFLLLSLSLSSIGLIAAAVSATTSAYATTASTTPEAVDDAPRFSHSQHRELEDAPKCTDCHDARAARPVGTTGTGPQRNDAMCISCHDEVPEYVARGRAPGLSLWFDHRPHAAQDCGTCHVDVAAAAPAPEHKMVATSATCFSCHARQLQRRLQGDVSGDRVPLETSCVKCHRREERRHQPASHDAIAWRITHGTRVMPNGVAAHGESCTLCHRESACIACHRVEAPRDHDGLWRTRTHGTAASWDRARCKTCHEPGQCIACHAVEEPLNHRGAWRSTHGLVARDRRDDSCATCHRQKFCNDCHRGLP